MYKTCRLFFYFTLIFSCCIPLIHWNSPSIPIRFTQPVRDSFVYIYQSNQVMQQRQILKTLPCFPRKRRQHCLHISLSNYFSFETVGKSWWFSENWVQNGDVVSVTGGVNWEQPENSWHREISVEEGVDLQTFTQEQVICFRFSPNTFARTSFIRHYTPLLQL